MMPGPLRRRFHFEWLWKAVAAGLCGSLAHSLLMYLKAAWQILPDFTPYESLQLALSAWLGHAVPAFVPWLISYLNGSTLVSFIYGQIHSYLPGSNGIVRGAVYGAACWAIMNVVFFPLIGVGIFAANAGYGIRPALFSLLMLESYSVTLGSVYALLYSASGYGKRR